MVSKCRQVVESIGEGARVSMDREQNRSGCRVGAGRVENTGKCH